MIGKIFLFKVDLKLPSGEIEFIPEVVVNNTVKPLGHVTGCHWVFVKGDTSVNSESKDRDDAIELAQSLKLCYQGTPLI